MFKNLYGYLPFVTLLFILCLTIARAVSNSREKRETYEGIILSRLEWKAYKTLKRIIKKRLAILSKMETLEEKFSSMPSPSTPFVSWRNHLRIAKMCRRRAKLMEKFDAIAKRYNRIARKFSWQFSNLTFVPDGDDRLPRELSDYASKDTPHHRNRA